MCLPVINSDITHTFTHVHSHTYIHTRTCTRTYTRNISNYSYLFPILKCSLFLFVGGLLSFPQEREVIGGPCGENDGNLQVGWWKVEKKNINYNENEKNSIPFNPFSIFGNKDKSVNLKTVKSDSNGFVQPVFMDIWRKEYVNSDENKTKMTLISRSALYVREKNNFGVFQRVYITRNFDSKDPITGAARDNYDSEFIDLDNNKIFVSKSADKENKENNDMSTNEEIILTKKRSKLAARFSRIEDIPAWERGENPAGTVSFVTPPTGKSLVLFDSVCLPHEVMLTIKGNRLALAGWMHEGQQEVPQWFNISS